MTEGLYLLDVNVLIALTNGSHVNHHPAHRWRSALPATAQWATTPLTESSFVRLMTNPVVVGRAIAPVDAIAVLARLRGLPAHVFLPDGSSLAAPDITVTALVGTKQVTDFHLVNLARWTGGVLATFDTRISESLAEADRPLVEVIPATVA